ncbi:MAG: SRPBCC family protein [Acidobacteria bacterium]|nr:SRPBCC family protein [Acidobacteriota bacterium]
MSGITRSVRANREFPCDQELVYDILTDYDRYKEWAPYVRESALLAEAGELAIASLDLAQSREEHISLECIHTTNRSVLHRVIEGDVSFKGLEWTLEPVGPQRCRVSVTIDGPSLMPLGAGRQFADAEGLLDAVLAYAGAYLPELEVEGDRGEVVLEIFEEETGLTCWYNGRQYQMVPVSRPRS